MFEHRLEIALASSSNYEKVNVEGQELYGYEAEILKLAREICADPSCMNDQAWAILDTKEAVHASDFVIHLGKEDRQHRHFPALLPRAVDWNTGQRLGFYLHGDPDHADAWLKSVFRALDSSTPPVFPLLAVLRAIGPTNTARKCLKVLMAKSLA